MTFLKFPALLLAEWTSERDLYHVALFQLRFLRRVRRNRCFVGMNFCTWGVSFLPRTINANGFVHLVADHSANDGFYFCFVSLMNYFPFVEHGLVYGQYRADVSACCLHLLRSRNELSHRAGLLQRLQLFDEFRSLYFLISEICIS